MGMAAQKYGLPCDGRFELGKGMTDEGSFNLSKGKASTGCAMPLSNCTCRMSGDQLFDLRPSTPADQYFSVLSDIAQASGKTYRTFDGGCTDERSKSFH
jgi:hypothetical protein